MNLKILIAGLAGAVAMFVWSAVAHTFLPLGMTGIHQVREDSPIPAALQSATGDKQGLYFFPGLGPDTDYPKKPTNEQLKAFDAKSRTMPTGLIIYNPPGKAKVMNPGMLGGEFVLELVLSLIAAWLVSRTAVAGFAARTLFVGAVGLAVGLATNGSYWIWYGFPTDYTLAQAAIQVIGFLVAGAAIAGVMGRRG